MISHVDQILVTQLKSSWPCCNGRSSSSLVFKNMAHADIWKFKSLHVCSPFHKMAIPLYTYMCSETLHTILNHSCPLEWFCQLQCNKFHDLIIQINIISSTDSFIFTRPVIWCAFGYSFKAIFVTPNYTVYTYIYIYIYICVCVCYS